MHKFRTQVHRWVGVISSLREGISTRRDLRKHSKVEVFFSTTSDDDITHLFSIGTESKFKRGKAEAATQQEGGTRERTAKNFFQSKLSRIHSLVASEKEQEREKRKNERWASTYTVHIVALETCHPTTRTSTRTAVFNVGLVNNNERQANLSRDTSASTPRCTNPYVDQGLVLVQQMSRRQGTTMTTNDADPSRRRDR